jgi:restriction endonuclease S subunit
MATVSIVRLKNIDMKDRIDAEYFQPEVLGIAEKLRDSPTLKEVAKPVTSAFYPAATQIYSTGNVPFLRCVDVVDYPVVSDLQMNYFEKLPDWFISENRTIKKLKAKEIVITKVGTPCYASVLDESLKEVALSRTVLGLTRIRIDPYYLVAFLRSRYGFLQLKRECELTIQLQLTLDRVGRIRVFIPPNTSVVEEIASLMKEYFKQLKDSLGLHEKAQKLFAEELNLSDLDKFTATVSYRESFSETQKVHRIDAEYFQPNYTKVTKKLKEIADKNGWKLETIFEISEPLRYGTSEKLEYMDVGRPFLRITDVQNLNFDSDSLCRISEQDAKKLDYALVKEGDLVISRSGTLGLTVVIGKELENSVFGSYFIRIRPKNEVIDSTYLAFYLNSILGRSQVERFSTGAIQTNLTIPAIENICVLIPNREVQEQISGLVKQSEFTKQKSKSLLKEAIGKVEKAIENKSSTER